MNRTLEISKLVFFPISRLLGISHFLVYSYWKWPTMIFFSILPKIDPISQTDVKSNKIHAKKLVRWKSNRKHREQNITAKTGNAVFVPYTLFEEILCFKWFHSVPFIKTINLIYYLFILKKRCNTHTLEIIVSSQRKERWHT